MEYFLLLSSGIYSSVSRVFFGPPPSNGTHTQGSGRLIRFPSFLKDITNPLVRCCREIRGSRPVLFDMVITLRWTQARKVWHNLLPRRCPFPGHQLIHGGLPRGGQRCVELSKCGSSVADHHLLLQHSLYGSKPSKASTQSQWSQDRLSCNQPHLWDRTSAEGTSRPQNLEHNVAEDGSRRSGIEPIGVS